MNTNFNSLGGRCPATAGSARQSARCRARTNAIGLALATAAAGAAAQSTATAEASEAAQLDPVEIRGHYDNSVGSSDAASGGVITPQLIEDRPLLRPGNLLEYVPGMVVTQHSGAGKANQYFLRGFNLDHGTDFSTWVAGMPVNLRTHGHGQGYTDLNFIIPELIAGVDYWKGPYHASIGDFSSAGGASMRYFDTMKAGLALATGGNDGYGRGLLAGSASAGPGVVTCGLELLHNDGPWQVPDHFRKYNAMLRSTQPLGEGKFSATAMAYGGTWNSTDQIAQRAVDSGVVGRFGSLDTSDGGQSQRYSFSADYATPMAGGQYQTIAYWFKYKLNLFSNFIYFLGGSGQRRPVRASRRSRCLRLDRQVVEARRAAGQPDRQHLRLRAAPGPHPAGRAVLDAASRAALDHPRRRRRRRKRRLLRAERHAMEQLVPIAHRSALRPLPLRRRQPCRAGLGQCRCWHLVAEGLADLRALEQDRILHQRRFGLSQQRRARRHDQGRPEVG